MEELEKKIRRLTADLAMMDTVYEQELKRQKENLIEEMKRWFSDSFDVLKADIASGDMENINISLVAFERKLKRFGVI